MDAPSLLLPHDVSEFIATNWWGQLITVVSWAISSGISLASTGYDIIRGYRAMRAKLALRLESREAAQAIRMAELVSPLVTEMLTRPAVKPEDADPEGQGLEPTTGIRPFPPPRGGTGVRSTDNGKS